MKLPSDLRKIIVFRALQLGDMLCCIPAVRALRKQHPRAKITLAGLPWAASFTTRFNNYFDDFISFPGYPGLPEQEIDPPALANFLLRVQQENFDLVLQMQGNGHLVNPLVEVFGARITAGFFKPDDYRPNGNYFLQYPDSGPEPERHIKLMSFLGVEPDGTDLEYPINDNDNDDYESLYLPINYRNYVCIHPGSRGSWRQWPAEHFAGIADHCMLLGYQVVLTGTEEESGLVKKVIALMKNKAIDTSGKTNLGTVAVLIKNAALLVSNCTGVSHIASALKTPSVVISMDGEPERWAPVNKNLHYTINWLDEPDYRLVFEKVTSLLDHN